MNQPMVIGWELLKEPCEIRAGYLLASPDTTADDYMAQPFNCSISITAFMRFKFPFHIIVPGIKRETSQTLRKELKTHIAKERAIGIKRKYRAKFKIYRPVVKLPPNRHYSKPLPLP